MTYFPRYHFTNAEGQPEDAKPPTPLQDAMLHETYSKLFNLANSDSGGLVTYLEVDGRLQIVQLTSKYLDDDL